MSTKERIYYKAMAGMSKAIAKIKEYEALMEAGWASISIEEIKHQIEFWKTEYKVWSTILKQNETNQ